MQYRFNPSFAPQQETFESSRLPAVPGDLFPDVACFASGGKGPGGTTGGSKGGAGQRGGKTTAPKSTARSQEKGKSSKGKARAHAAKSASGGGSGNSPGPRARKNG